MSSLSTRLIWPSGLREKVRLLPTGKSGGAGEIFHIEGKPDYVAKIYHASTDPAEREKYAKKISWMIDNKPDLPEIPPGHESVVQLAWPVATTHGPQGFTGFVMQKIDFSRTLELDYLLTRRQAAQEGFQADFGKLVAISYNLASLISCLHSKKIAVVDLKPMNLKVYKNELFVSILDCDGFRIYADNFTSEAPQVTPEYLAPEFHDKAVSHPESQDWFALATIIFRLLNFGVHPFVGISKNTHGIPSELAQRIKMGLYPYGRVPHRTVKAVPASVHEAFPDKLRELFDRSFDWSVSGRPSAAEWIQVLEEYANKHSGLIMTCAKGHLQFAGKPCPSCLRESILQKHQATARRRTITRLALSPGKTLRNVQRTMTRVPNSPFQAGLIQAQAQGAGAPVPTTALYIETYRALVVEALWIAGLAISWWWLK